MSLSANWKTKNRNRPPPEVSKDRVSPLDPLNGKEGIMRHSELISILERTLGDLRLQPLEYKKIKSQGFRERAKRAKWRLSELLGYVDDPIWSSMVRSVYDGQIKNINNSQMNGDWRLAEHEIELAPDAAGDDSMILYTLYVDIAGQNDLGYRDGKAVDSIDVNVHQAPSQSSPELTAVLDRLVRVQEKQAGISNKDNGAD